MGPSTLSTSLEIQSHRPSWECWDRDQGDVQAEESSQESSPDPYENINAIDKLQGYKTCRNLYCYPMPFLLST